MKEVDDIGLPILMVDDEEQFLLSATTALATRGIDNVTECSDSRQVMELLEKRQYAVILLDLVMPHLSGEELLKQIREFYPDQIVVMLTAINEVETVVNCMRAGAFDYILKPVDHTRLETTLKRALAFYDIQRQNRLLRSYLLTDTLEQPHCFGKIITADPIMKKIFQYMEAIAPTPLPVLISGESGVGKELVAEAVHELSGRKGEMVTVNVAGLDDHLFSDTLFGHKRGAFTGADRERGGLIEKAAGGTLFLDEIGDLAAESQVKLLRLLQHDSSYYPIGSDATKVNRARIVCATNADLEARQSEGSFRRDLYYRLRTHHVKIPPLRDRSNDLPVLLDHFFDKAAEMLGRSSPKAPPELLTLLKNYPFPGNIRELESMVYDALSRHRSGRLSLDAFREKILPDYHGELPLAEPALDDAVQEEGFRFPETLPALKQWEQWLIDEALRRTNDNQRQAAELIGLSRRALNNRLARGEGKG